MSIFQFFTVLVILWSYLRFLAKFAVDPKYCLVIVDLFTSKIYVYPMKNRSLLAKKLNLF